MKPRFLPLLVLSFLIFGAITAGLRLGAADNAVAPWEYATLRWDGRSNTHLIRPNGTVESLGTKFAGIKKPNDTDDRSFYMNLALNGLAREGYELVAMTPDDYVVKRQPRP